MKRIISSLFILCAIYAQAQTFDWLTTLSATETSKAQTNIQYAAYYADSSALVFGNYGSLATTDAGVLGEKQYKGAEYGTASGYNKNFILAKIDKSGKVLWAVHSEDGDVSDSQSAVTATSDGGAVLALKFRHSDHNRQDGVSSPLYKIIDASDKSFSRDMEYTGAWINQPVIVRVDKDGKVTAVKDMWVSSEKAAKSENPTTDAFTFSAAIEDEAGNIFIAGSQSLNMALGTDTLFARPQPDWDGTTTNGRYNGFVLKLDAELNYKAHISSVGTVLYDKPSCVAIRDNKIYFTGLAKAEEEVKAELQLGEKKAEVKELCVVNACLTTDLAAEWLSATPIVRYNNKQGNNLYQTLLSKDGSTLYVTGGMQGAVVLGEDTIHSGGEQLSTMNDGYIYAFSTTDGSLSNAAVTGETKLNLSHGMVELGDSLYVYNYFFGDIRQAVYAKDLTRGSVTSLATGGGSSTLVYTASLNGQVLLALRSKGGQDFKVFDTTQNIPGLWFNTLVAFHLEEPEPTKPDQGMEKVQSDKVPSDKVQKIMQEGRIIIIRNNKSYSITGEEL